MGLNILQDVKISANLFTLTGGVVFGLLSILLSWFALARGVVVPSPSPELKIVGSNLVKL
jgi:hypothetical protein